MTAEQNVRLSQKEQLILDMLIKAGRRGLYGLQLVQQSEGALRRGTVYVTLDRMEQKGFVESKQESKEAGISGIPRRIYAATWYGIRVHQAWEKLQGLSVFRIVPPTDQRGLESAEKPSSRGLAADPDVVSTTEGSQARAL